MTELNQSDEPEIDVLQLINRIKSAKSIGTWPMAGAAIIRTDDVTTGRVIEFSRDGNSLRVMVEFDGEQPALYRLGSSVFSRVIVPVGCEVPRIFANLAERPSDRRRREQEGSCNRNF